MATTLYARPAAKAHTIPHMERTSTVPSPITSTAAPTTAPSTAMPAHTDKRSRHTNHDKSTVNKGALHRFNMTAAATPMCGMAAK